MYRCVCPRIVYKSEHGNIAGEPTADNIIHPRIFKDVHQSLPEYTPDERAKALLGKEALCIFAHSFERVGIRAVIMLHLMRKQNAQAGGPMPSIKIITQQIRRASEYDLPIFGAVFQRSIELDCRDKLIVVKQERQIPCEYALDRICPQKFGVSLKRRV